MQPYNSFFESGGYGINKLDEELSINDIPRSILQDVRQEAVLSLLKRLKTSGITKTEAVEFYLEVIIPPLVKIIVKQLKKNYNVAKNIS